MKTAFLAGIAALFLATGTTLGGCTEQSLAQCELEAMRVYPNSKSKYDAQITQFVGTCMKARGYGLAEGASESCTSQPGCYTPTDPIEKFFAGLASKRR